MVFCNSSHCPFGTWLSLVIGVIWLKKLLLGQTLQPNDVGFVGGFCLHFFSVSIHTRYQYIGTNRLK